MATKSGQQEPEKAEVVEELLDALDTALDRVKVLYEQYFLGIQKQPPSYLHTDVERKIRDITQLHVRNTALRYRFATLQQKFGAYNAYWRRTLRQIENGTYTRNLSKIGRHAARTGAAVPEEILAAMPKRMRAQVERDREAALALARLRDQKRLDDPELLTLTDEDVDIDLAELEPAAVIRESSDVRRKVLRARGPYTLADADADFNQDAFFASVTGGDEPDLDAVTPVVMWRPSNVPAAPQPPPVAGRTGDPPPAEASGSPAAAGAGSPAVPVAPLTPAGPVPALAPPATQGVVRAVMPAPSQATRPSPVAPGASAVYAPTAVETLAGPFPRIPSLPALPSKQRPDAGASPVGVEPGEHLAPASPVAAVERVRAPRPPLPQPRRTAGQAVQPGRAGPSAERTPVPDRLSPGERTPAPERLPSSERTTAPERLPSSEREPAPEHLSPSEREPAPERLSPSERTPVPEQAPPSERSAAQRPTAQRGAPRSRQGPPPGMSNADVNALYVAYIKAKQALGEDAGPGAYAKLLKTINAQAPKIMEQYKAKRVDFSVVVKDNQVIIRAKPRP